MSEYTVVSCPKKELAFTNHVYCSLDNMDLLCNVEAVHENRVLIGEMVYNVKSNEAIQREQIGLSAVQRETLQCTIDSRVSVAPWNVPEGRSCGLYRITFLVELMAGGRKSLNEEQLMQHILRNYVHQVFTKNQIVVTDFNGTAVKLTVQQVAIAVQESNRSDDPVLTTTPRGILLASTEIKLITADQSKFLSLTKNHNNNGAVVIPTLSASSDAQFQALREEMDAMKKRVEQLEMKIQTCAQLEPFDEWKFAADPIQEFQRWQLFQVGVLIDYYLAFDLGNNMNAGTWISAMIASRKEYSIEIRTTIDQHTIKVDFCDANKIAKHGKFSK